MELKLDLLQPVQETVASLDPSHVWALSVAVDDVRSPIERGKRPYSYWAECECPDDCPRDHENE